MGGVVATTDVSPGQSVLVAQPLVTVVNEVAQGAVCSYCFEFMDAKTRLQCAECHAQFYCSAACQESAAADHAGECEVLILSRLFCGAAACHSGGGWTTVFD